MSNKINIALVEDYKLVRAGLKSVLDEVDGFNIVFETDKGKEAIDYTINYKPDIVLLDIGLPDINGIRVISEIKKAQLDSRIIVLTANTDFNIINKCLSLGIYAYVLKDIAIETLVNVIKMVNKGAMWFAPRIADLIRVKSKNIMTLESIAKYRLKNVAQCELNENIGFNLDKAMRFIEFQSPDVIYFEGITTKEGLDFFTSLTLKNKTIVYFQHHDYEKPLFVIHDCNK